MELGVSEAIERSRRGDIDALEPIYREHRELVFRICYRMAGDQAQAADWTQEIFIRVFERIGSYKGKANFSTWLYRVAMNYCLDQLKKSSRKAVPLESIQQRASTENPSENLLRKEKSSVIWQVLESLDPKLRAVLVLKDMEELSYAEISRKLDIPEGTVGSRLNQARKELAEKLRDHFAMN
ncbi:sigma-70 family RNA polymerase sigma factor [Acidobacteria bacterium AH-259-D05]|nr:sigma-70 family RNA polymerase sigma factor [Acidobacteria bacterium AH-259-D05]